MAPGRLGRAAAWVSAIACLPYLILKVLWTLDIPVGVADQTVFASDDWLASNALMAFLQLAGLLLVLVLTRSWAHRVPPWLLLFPAWVGTGLLFQVSVGAVTVAAFSASSQAGAPTGEFQPWVFMVVYPAFALQGAALAVAFVSHVRVRWGGVLSQRTGEVVARRTVGVRWRPVAHLSGMAEAVAGMAVGVAVVLGFWAAGGSLGSSAVLAESAWGMQASRVAGAVVAVVGLLGLSGRWGRRRRLWLPAALTWLGSGAMAAFDGLGIVLFVLLGADLPGAGWGLADTVLAVKATVGLLAAAVGTSAVVAAAGGMKRQDRFPEHTTAGPTRPGAAVSRPISRSPGGSVG